jgi:hypothetical protein
MIFNISLFNFKFVRTGSWVVLVGLLLNGCAGNDENTAEAGLVLHVAQTHYQKNEVVGATELAVGGYAQNTLEHHTLRDQNGVELSLYRTYLVIDDIRLLPCNSLAQLPVRLLNFVFPNAIAHAGHGSEPVGGRALDKPNVIDLITQDGFILPLGDAAIAPGRYCEVQVSLTRLAGEGYGQPPFVAASNDDAISEPEVPETSGRIFTMRADYCALRNGAQQCLQRQQVNIDDTGLAEPLTQTLNLLAPLEINATLREAYITIGIEYDGWLANIDATLLDNDANERQKLLDNISASFRVFNQGLGDLPPNIVSD